MAYGTLGGSQRLTVDGCIGNTANVGATPFPMATRVFSVHWKGTAASNLVMRNGRTASAPVWLSTTSAVLADDVNLGKTGMLFSSGCYLTTLCKGTFTYAVVNYEQEAR